MVTSCNKTYHFYCAISVKIEMLPVIFIFLKIHMQIYIELYVKIHISILF